MFQMRRATDEDRAYWFSLDRHMGEGEFALKVRDGRGYVLCDGETPVGILRYNLFWDNTPFLTLIYLEQAHRGRGFGQLAMRQWEAEMRQSGYRLLMTSTQVDEQAQHFYRKLGYKDCGCLVLDIEPFAQPMEMFLIKLI